ncbi:MAG: hypothetical protein IPL20_06550 [Saprospiraceae bacterium]|nr:hypothetical protein [Saprospiraceae bacterium]
MNQGTHLHKHGNQNYVSRQHQRTKATIFHLSEFGFVYPDGSITKVILIGNIA